MNENYLLFNVILMVLLKVILLCLCQWPFHETIVRALLKLAFPALQSTATDQCQSNSPQNRQRLLSRENVSGRWYVTQRCHYTNWHAKPLPPSSLTKHWSQTAIEASVNFQKYGPLQQKMNRLLSGPAAWTAPPSEPSEEPTYFRQLIELPVPQLIHPVCRLVLGATW